MAKVDNRTVPIPAFLGRAYFGFVRELIAEPGSNPTFLRESRRAYRRLRISGGTLPFLALSLTIGAGIASIGILYLLQSLATPVMWSIPLLVVFYAPSFLASVLFFFLIYGVARDLSDRETLQQLYLTPMHPQEIVFGMIWGSALPMSLPVACLIPGVAIMGLHLYMTTDATGMIDLAAPAALPLVFWPHTLASMISSGAIAAAITFGLESRQYPLARGLAVWLGFEIFLFLPLTAYSIVAWPLTFLVGGLAAILLRLIVAGGFLQHLALRVAQQSIDEDMR
ncbi:hypothetical protein GC173_05080 [bacterium]|nr:hypothetical protein [bacterium]